MSDLTIADWFWAGRAIIPTSQPGNTWHRITWPFSATFGPLARLIAMLLLCAGGFVWLSGEAAASPPGGPFTLQDGDGRQVTDRDFRGKYMLVYFGYTYCPDICPTTLNEVVDALDRLGAKADQVQAIFITVDPKRDIPTVVKQYAAAFSPRLIGLTGSSEQIAQVAKTYRVYYAETRIGPEPNDYAMAHSSVLYLMGPGGEFVAPIRGDESGRQIAEDLSRLMS
jgi:cytochrome oxidase Cu insertion factor (SCO1/SenC/PrrC family)